MQDNNVTKSPGGEKPESHPEEDGRNKEWQDRARVNLEQVPEGKHTNVERDFEPENPREQQEKKDVNY